MTQPEQYLQENPQYIVVFRQPGPQNEEVLAAVLETRPLGDVGVRSSRTILQSRNGVHARVYQRLAVAAANLSVEQRRQLGAHSEVLSVVRNQRRRLPPVYPSPAYPGPQDDAVQDGQRAYMLGMRDVLNQLLGASQTGLMTGLGTGLVPPAPRAGSLTPPTNDPLTGNPLAGNPLAGPAAGWSRALEQIGLTPDYRVATGKQVKVAVLDTGLDSNHPDLTLKVGNGRSFVPSEPTTQDLNGHGTHCAGVIAGRATPAGVERYSVAPDAELLIGKVLDQFGSGYDDQILEGIDWAADQGAEVISMSLGSGRLAGQPYSDPYEVVAQVLLTQGIILVAAAGNDSRRPAVIAPVGNPAACPSVLAVAAVDGRDRVAAFSCGAADGIGSIDIAAPGVGILSAMPGGGYQRLSGTSMATPHVAGVLALLRELHPDKSGEALWQLLKAAARSTGAPASDVGAGIVQVPQGADARPPVELIPAELIPTTPTPLVPEPGTINPER